MMGPALRRAGTRGLAAGLAACLLLALVGGPAGAQAAPDLAVVVHPDVPVEALTFAELRRVLLGDREFWSSGVRVTLLIRAPVARERDVAVKGVCEMTEAQFRQHWIAKVFRNETPSGPKIVYSNEMAIDQVMRTPGAITFIEATKVSKGMKVLKIDGLLPGQPGYKVK